MKIRQISFRLFVWLQRVLFCGEKLSHVSHVPVHAPLRTMVSWCLLVCAVAHVSARRLFGSKGGAWAFLEAHAVEVPLVWEARMCAGTGL